MANVYLDDTTLTAIANAIRAKTGSNALITPANMDEEIASIQTGEVEYDNGEEMKW